MNKAKGKMWEGIRVLTNYPIKHNKSTGQYYEDTKTNWLFGLRRTSVSRVWDENGYRISANLKRFKKHIEGQPNKPVKRVTKEYGKNGKFRRKEVIKPGVSARKKS
ncbi:hypothetical protein KKB11_00720 [Candidatus Micrarchaeota archaeon]|nr:hypothetical protein [Candidatus Micrarchaeota archaeon]